MANINEKFEAIKAQFSDLNGLHPGLWPIAPRLVAVTLLFAVVVAVGWMFYWNEQLSEIDKGQQEEQKLRDSFKVKMQQSISLDALREQRKLVLQYVSRMEKQLPSTAHIDALLEDLNSAANGRGVAMDLFKPGTISVKDYYAELPIEINVNANYHDMGKFVADVAKLPRIVTLNNLSLEVSKDAKNPGIVLKGIAKTYRYLDPEEIAIHTAETKKAKEVKK